MQIIWVNYCKIWVLKLNKTSLMLFLWLKTLFLPLVRLNSSRKPIFCENLLRKYTCTAKAEGNKKNQFFIILRNFAHLPVFKNIAPFVFKRFLKFDVFNIVTYKSHSPDKYSLKLLSLGSVTALLKR